MGIDIHAINFRQLRHLVCRHAPVIGQHHCNIVDIKQQWKDHQDAKYDSDVSIWSQEAKQSHHGRYLEEEACLDAYSQKDDKAVHENCSKFNGLVPQLRILAHGRPVVLDEVEPLDACWHLEAQDGHNEQYFAHGENLQLLENAKGRLLFILHNLDLDALEPSHCQPEQNNQGERNDLIQEDVHRQVAEDLQHV